MINVKFNFDEKGFRSKVEKEVKDKGKQEIEGKLRGLRCPDHGSAPTVTSQGSLSGKLSWNVNTCCDKLMDMVKSRVGNGASSSDDFAGRSMSGNEFGGSYSGGIGE
jgi:hypothetical protein